MAKGGVCRRRCHGNGLLAGIAGSTPWQGVVLMCLRARTHLCVRVRVCHRDVKSSLVFITSLSLQWWTVRELWYQSFPEDSLSLSRSVWLHWRCDRNAAHPISFEWRRPVQHFGFVLFAFFNSMNYLRSSSAHNCNPLCFHSKHWIWFECSLNIHCCTWDVQTLR